MAMLFNPFKMPKPRPFNYMPLYYDERKEQLEKLKEAAAADKSKPRVNLQKGFLHDQRARNKSQLEKGSVIRWGVIIAAAIAGFMILLPRIDKFVMLLAK
ncbi:MAG: hypothetical protein LBN37_02970 [Bacteroidales bacterium]|jgi:hypothetical protein|nr:hypothetical protein [Bacteroidales bacterium]